MRNFGPDHVAQDHLHPKVQTGKQGSAEAKQTGICGSDQPVPIRSLSSRSMNRNLRSWRCLME